jgi:hypothetical protein
MDSRLFRCSRAGHTFRKRDVADNQRERGTAEPYVSKERSLDITDITRTTQYLE